MFLFGATTIMYDPEERAELLKEHAALVARLRSPEVQARMIADGLDSAAELKKLAGHIDTFLAADDDYEKAVDHSLHKAADVADAEYRAFKALRQFVQELKQVNPLHPQLEEWEDYLEAWAERMPKEQEE